MGNRQKGLAGNGLEDQLFTLGLLVGQGAFAHEGNSVLLWCSADSGKQNIAVSQHGGDLASCLKRLLAGLSKLSSPTRSLLETSSSLLETSCEETINKAHKQQPFPGGFLPQLRFRNRNTSDLKLDQLMSLGQQIPNPMRCWVKMHFLVGS